MLFTSESVLRQRAEIARQCQSGEITEMEAGARFIEADPDYGGGYLLLANAGSIAGHREEAEPLYWKALERMPCDYKAYMALPEVRRASLPGDPLSDRLMVLGIWKLALSREIPGGVGALFRDQFPQTDFDFQDPATFEALAIAAETKGVPPEIRDRMLPYELLNDLQRESSGGMGAGLVQDILTNSERTIPIWRAALREWAGHESVLQPDALCLLIALLGEMAGTEVLDDLLELADFGERPIFLHANWAIWRMGQRFSTEALARFRKATTGARPTLRCALAEQIHLLPETPEMEAALLELLEDFHNFAGKEDAQYLLATVIHALEGLGCDRQAEHAFQKFQALLPEAARKWVRDALDEGFVPRLVHEEIEGLTIQEICCDRILMEDEEDLSGHDELDDEEFEEITPVVAPPKPGRNEPCWCGSGKKYKKCHLASDEQEARRAPAGEPKTTAEPSDAKLQRELIHVALEGRKPAEYAEAHLRYFGHPPEERNPNGQDDSLGGFIEWYIYDFRPRATGRTVIEEYLRKHAGRLTAAECEKLESWRGAQFGIWEVERVERGKGVELKNLFEDEHFFVYDVSSSRSLVRWDCVVARVHQFEGKWYFVANGIVVPRSAMAQLIEKIEQESKEAGQTPAAFVRSNSHRWHRVVHEMARQRLADLRVVNAEGDELEFCSAVYRVEDEESVIARFEAATQFEADNSNDAAVRTFAWLEQGVEGLRRSYGRIEIRDGKLRLECNSRKRLAIGRQLVEKYGYGVIEHLGDSFQSLEALKREALAEKPRAKGAYAPLPPEVEREVISKVKAEHYARWVDEPLPALEGRTPRQAARSEVGRRQLEDLLRTMENAEERSRQQGGVAFDFVALRKALDL
jgi:hypothetical protein